VKPLLVLPILIPLAAAAASLLVWRSPRAQRLLALAGALGLFGAGVALLIDVHGSGIQAVVVGGWPAPFGISLVADLFSAIMVVIAGLIGLAVVIYSFATMDAPREAHGYYPLYSVLLMGISGAFLTGDIFNLYVWFEVLLMASFVLLVLGGTRAQMEGGLKYVTLNLLASALFLAAVGILYGATGTLSMADLSVKLRGLTKPGLATAISMLFLVAFGIKAAVFPLFFWLPASYHTPPVAVTAIFGGMLTKVGVYAMIRVFTLLFVDEPGYTHSLLLVIAGFTMVTGVLGAVAHNDFRRILSFHIISQIGYMILGLGIYSTLAIAGAIFFMVHNIIAKTNLFLVSGAAYRLRGSYDLKEIGGLYRDHPRLALLFMTSAMALAGIPPLSGFLGKLTLVRAGLEAEQYAIVAVALGVSLLTLFSMTKIWGEAFWKPAPQPAAVIAEGGGSQVWGPWPLQVLPIAALAALNVLLGVWGESFLALSHAAARQLIDPREYIHAVLGR
jgi:multicomponent Na+:H+ antiporter subunit D